MSAQHLLALCLSLAPSFSGPVLASEPSSSPSLERALTRLQSRLRTLQPPHRANFYETLEAEYRSWRDADAPDAQIRRGTVLPALALFARHLDRTVRDYFRESPDGERRLEGWLDEVSRVPVSGYGRDADLRAVDLAPGGRLFLPSVLVMQRHARTTGVANRDGAIWCPLC